MGNWEAIVEVDRGPAQLRQISPINAENRQLKYVVA